MLECIGKMIRLPVYLFNYDFHIGYGITIKVWYLIAFVFTMNILLKFTMPVMQVIARSGKDHKKQNNNHRKEKKVVIERHRVGR